MEVAELAGGCRSQRKEFMIVKEKQSANEYDKKRASRIANRAATFENMTRKGLEENLPLMFTLQWPTALQHMRKIQILMNFIRFLVKNCT